MLDQAISNRCHGMNLEEMKMNRHAPYRDRRPQSAFTLIELLVVISIISLLISILLPALGAARKSARSTMCLNSLRSCGMSMMFYTNDNKERFCGVNPYFSSGSQVNAANSNAPQFWVTWYQNKHANYKSSSLICADDDRSNYIRNANGVNYGSATEYKTYDISSSYGSLSTYVFAWRQADNTVPSIRRDSIAKPSERVVFADAWNRFYFSNTVQEFYASHNDSFNMVFVDGHAGTFNSGSKPVKDTRKLGYSIQGISRFPTTHTEMPWSSSSF
jgi:prepilin-type N-terminal cleavage/methylation domain-containing protein/prepilin-type processing-associated H-X9-DG protein